jgi:phosphatidylinositol alpha-mannosyltransferase
MKIGLVCPYNIARGGGVQEIVRAMRTELELRGHTAKIITPQPKDVAGFNTQGVLFLGSSTDFRSPLHTTTQLSVSVDTEAIEQMIEIEQFDILHFHEPWVPFFSRQILTRSSSVNVATFHAKIPETLMSRTVVKVVTPYLRGVLKYLHQLTAVSDAAAEYVSGLTEQPITIIPNGIDLDRYKKPLQSRNSKKLRTILYIGRLERRKGVNYLLKAYHLFSERQAGVELIIAGDGPDREKLELMVEELHIPRVHFLGHISEEKKLDLLAKSDLFCSPAIYGESFGIVLLEAMASGLVTVAGNNSGYEGVLQGIGGMSLVNSKDTIEFTRRISLMLNEAPLRTVWQNWAADYVQQFSYQKIVEQYEMIYEQSRQLAPVKLPVLNANA